MSIIWFMGLSGAGKSTLALALREQLSLRRPTIVLDSDEMRPIISSDLGFSYHDRMENVSRLARLAKQLESQKMLVIVAAITPLEIMRTRVRELLPDAIQIFVDTPLSLCQLRDPKGLYRSAAEGALPNFTGISHRFEKPLHADIVCKTAEMVLPDCVQMLLNLISRETSPASNTPPRQNSTGSCPDGLTR